MKLRLQTMICASLMAAVPFTITMAQDVPGESLSVQQVAPVALHSVKETAKTTDAIRHISNIPVVYGDGIQVAAVAISYPEPVKASSLSKDTYVVEGKTINRVYVNDTPAMDVKGNKKSGPYVIVEFEHVNSTPFTMADRPKRNNSENNAAPKDASSRSDRKVPVLSSSVEQKKVVESKTGKQYVPTTSAITSTTVEPSLIDEFKTYTFTDEAVGATMPYNIYLPKNYDSNKQYPLYVFIGDASTNINNDKTVLFQGDGAMVFAAPEEQAKHEAIILAPQYTQDLVDQLGMMTTDENVWTPGLQLVTDLIHHIIETYPVDTDRIYGSGQSQGGMANIAISDRYPDLFTAQFLVACQWNTEEMKVLKDKKLWILVSEGDEKAYPSMNTATKNWEDLGAKVARSPMWNSYSTPEQFDVLVNDMKAQKANINYSVFEGGSHMYTWSVAYSIEGIRDWLFSQSKSEK